MHFSFYIVDTKKSFCAKFCANACKPHPFWRRQRKNRLQNAYSEKAQEIFIFSCQFNDFHSHNHTWAQQEWCMHTNIYIFPYKRKRKFFCYISTRGKFFFFEKKEHHSWHIHMHQTRKRSPENLRKKFMRFELKNDFAFCVLLIVRLLLMIVVFYCVISFVHMLQAYSIWWKDAMNRNCKKLSF